MRPSTTILSVILQICFIDIVFSFDSILTAIGIIDARLILIMIIAVVISMFIMFLFSEKVSSFIEKIQL